MRTSQSEIRLKNRLLILSIFACLIILLGRDCVLLFQFEGPAGVDGYYYALQIDTLKNSGNLYFSTFTPLILYFLTLLSFLTQNSILAVKLGALLIHASMSISAMALVTTLTRNSWFSLFGLFIGLSNLHLYMISEFITYAGALTLLFWSAFCLLKAIQTRKYGWNIVSALLLILALFSHRSIIGILFIAGLVTLSAYLLMTRKIVGGLVTAFLFLFPLILSRQVVYSFPGGISNELANFPQNPFRSLIIAESLIILAVIIAAFAIVFFKREALRKDPSGIVLVSIALFCLLITLNPFWNHQTGLLGIVARLDLLIYIQAAVAVPVLLTLLYSYSKKIVLVPAALFLWLFVGSFLTQLPVGLRPEYLQAREKLSRDLSSMKSEMCETPYVIAQHGEQFLATYVLGVPAGQTRPTDDRYQCILWLVHGMKNENNSENEGSSLIEDSEMAEYLKALSNERRPIVMRNNPHLRAY